MKQKYSLFFPNVDYREDIVTWLGLCHPRVFPSAASYTSNVKASHTHFFPGFYS